MKEKIKYFVIAFLIVILDQVTKIMVRANMPLYSSKQIIGELFQFTHVENTGAAFSFSLGNILVDRVVFIAITIIATIMFSIFLIKNKNRIENLCLGLIIGGAIGNLIDRVLFGRVTDFLDCEFPNIDIEFLNWHLHRWPVFNIADSAIVVAITIFIISEIFIKKNKLEQSDEQEI